MRQLLCVRYYLGSRSIKVNTAQFLLSVTLESTVEMSINTYIYLRVNNIMFCNTDTQNLVA